MEQENVDAAIGLSTDQIPGLPGSCLPRILPGDSALRQQGDDSFGDRS
jgi:hypothetical protein